MGGMESQEIADLLEAKKIRPNSWIARCPDHDDHKPRLTVTATRDRTLVHCWAGCQFSDVVKSAGLKPRDMFLASRSQLTPRARSKIAQHKELREWRDRKEGEIRIVVHRKNQLISKGEELVGRSGPGVHGSEIDWGPQGKVKPPSKVRGWGRGMDLITLGYTGFTKLEWLLDLLISKHKDDWIEARGFLGA